MTTDTTPMTTSAATRYNNAGLSFHMGRCRFIAQNIVFEQFHRVIPMHAHSEGCYEIHYIPYGCGTVILNGTEHHLNKDSLFVTGPHISHQQIPEKENPMAEYCIFLQTQEDRRLRDSSAGAGNSILSAFLSTPLWIGRDTQNIHLVMQNLFLELSRKQAGYTEIVQSMLQQIIVLMVRNYSALVPSGAVSSVPGNQQSLILDESFLYDYATLTLDSLSKRLALSPRQTQRLLREKYNQTFQQKKTAARMSAAVILLQSTDFPIAEIAEQLGFSSSEHFTNAFRTYAGISPRQYRKEHAASPVPPLSPSLQDTQPSPSPPDARDADPPETGS